MEKVRLNPLVSVCIPAYNAKEYIVSTLNSLVQQTYRNLEIIVVEDGSAMPCKKEVESFLDPRIKYYFQKNGGAGNARNKAFHFSTGDYIKFMDADDLLSNNSIEAQVNCIIKNEATIVSGQWGRFYNDDLSTFKLSEEKVWKSMDAISWIQQSWLQGPNMTQPGIFLFSRKLVEKAGLWTEELSVGPMDDMEYYTRLILNADNVTFCEESLLMYRSGLNDSLSKVKSEQAMEIALKTIELATDCLLKFDQTENSKRAISTQYQVYIYNVYSVYNHLYKKALGLQKRYGKNDFEFPAGGITKVLKSLVGWKVAKQIKKRLKI